VEKDGQLARQAGSGVRVRGPAHAWDWLDDTGGKVEMDMTPGPACRRGENNVLPVQATLRIRDRHIHCVAAGPQKEPALHEEVARRSHGGPGFKRLGLGETDGAVGTIARHHASENGNGRGAGGKLFYRNGHGIAGIKAKCIGNFRLNGGDGGVETGGVRLGEEGGEFGAGFVAQEALGGGGARKDGERGEMDG